MPSCSNEAPASGDTILNDASIMRNTVVGANSLFRPYLLDIFSATTFDQK